MIELLRNVLYLASGMAIGYFVATNRHEKAFQERLAKETEDLEETFKLKYSRKAAKDYVTDPVFQEQAMKAAAAMEEYGKTTIGPSVLQQEMTAAVRRAEAEAAEADEKEEAETPVVPVVEEPPAPKPPVSVVPEQTVGKVNYNAYSTAPKEDEPVEATSARVPLCEVIERDDFDDNAAGFEETTLTYFVKDDRLANVEDQVLTNEAREAFFDPEVFELLKSSEARGGSPEVYLRNNRAKRIFEIVINEFAYTDEVGEVVYAAG